MSTIVCDRRRRRGGTEGVPLLGQEGWTRHQENAAKPPLQGAAGVVSSAKTSARRSDHPVCAASERDLSFNGAANPPVPGGEYPRLTIFRSPKNLLKKG